MSEGTANEPGGGISQKDIESIRVVIHQLRAGLPNVEILLATGTFGSTDPRSPEELAKDKRSGVSEYGVALKTLAAEEGCAFLNMTEPWVEYMRSVKVHPHVFYRDRVHANEFGEPVSDDCSTAEAERVPGSAGDREGRGPWAAGTGVRDAENPSGGFPPGRGQIELVEVLGAE